MNIVLKTLAWAVGFAAVFVICAVWLGFRGRVSFADMIFMYSLWAVPSLCIIAATEWYYQRTLKRLRAGKGINKS